MVEYLKASFWGAVARKTIGTAVSGFLIGLSTTLTDDGVRAAEDWVVNGATGAVTGAVIGVLLPILSRIAAKEAATDIPKI